MTNSVSSPQIVKGSFANLDTETRSAAWDTKQNISFTYCIFGVRTASADHSLPHTTAFKNVQIV